VPKNNPEYISIADILQEALTNTGTDPAKRCLQERSILDFREYPWFHLTRTEIPMTALQRAHL